MVQIKYQADTSLEDFDERLGEVFGTRDLAGFTPLGKRISAKFPSRGILLPCAGPKVLTLLSVAIGTVD